MNFVPPTSSGSPTTRAWQGSLQLRFADRQGQTQLSHSQAIAPYKIQKPFQHDDGTAQVVMLHTAGGIVGGDRLTADIQLAAKTQALLTTAAATKVYRSQGEESQQRTEIQVGSEALLEWLPQETIVFEQAQFRQDLRIDLADYAQVVLWEMTRFGRTAMGERFVQGNWRSQTEIWRSNVPLWIDRQWLPGNEAIWASPHGLAGCPIVGTLAWVGQAVIPEFVQELRDLATVSSTSAQFGVSRLPQGVVCRYRGSSTAQGRSWFIRVWRRIRQAQGRSLELPRVWML